MKVDEFHYVSVSQMELVHIINRPDPVSIPGAPDYCGNIIIWNDNILPVVDIATLYKHGMPQSSHEVVAVIIYRDQNNDIQYGGIGLYASPELEHVENQQVCAVPDQPECLRTISLSCFISKDGHEVPILDMGKLFSRDLAYEVSNISAVAS